MSWHERKSICVEAAHSYSRDYYMTEADVGVLESGSPKQSAREQARIRDEKKARADVDERQEQTDPD